MKIEMTRNAYTMVRYEVEIPYALVGQQFEVVSDEGTHWFIESGTEHPFKGELYAVAKEDAQVVDDE